MKKALLVVLMILALAITSNAYAESKNLPIDIPLKDYIEESFKVCKTFILESMEKGNRLAYSSNKLSDGNNYTCEGDSEMAIFTIYPTKTFIKKVFTGITEFNLIMYVKLEIGVSSFEFHKINYRPTDITENSLHFFIAKDGTVYLIVTNQHDEQRI